MTLQEAKDQVARNDGHESGWDLDYEYDMTFTAYRILMDRAALLYGDSQYNQAIEKSIKISENRQDESTDNAEYLGHLKVIEELKKLKR